jgi:predicted alpha/beta hydrolase family esterase
MPENEAECHVDTLILPGLHGSNEGHWQAHWANDHKGSKMVMQEDWNCPDLATWRLRVETELAEHQNVWIVAHSLGCILTANLAESPFADRISGALLVAPCDLARVEALHPCVVNFGAMPEKRLPFPSVVVGSLNDPYMDFNTAVRSADAWGSDLVEIGHAGHINIASGFGRWTAGYDFLELLKTRAAGAGRATGRLPSPLPSPGLSPAALH